jgi:hypothetical protein
MRKCCFVGDSHLAAIKLGWDQMGQDHPDFDCDFFASQIGSIDDTYRAGALLVPANETVRRNFIWTSGGKSVIDLSQYSDVVLVGMGFSVEPLLLAYSQSRTERHNNRSGIYSFVSEAAFDAIIANHLRSAPLFRTLERIRDGGPRVWGLAQPGPSEQVLDGPDNAELAEPFSGSGSGLGLLNWLRDWQTDKTAEFHQTVAAWLRTVVQHGDHAALASSFARIVASLAEPDFRPMPQPPATLSTGLFTKREYSVGSVRLTRGYNVPHVMEEYRHMNAAYGAVVLSDLLPRLRRARDGGTLAAS